MFWNLFCDLVWHCVIFALYSTLESVFCCITSQNEEYYNIVNNLNNDSELITFDEFESHFSDKDNTANNNNDFSELNYLEKSVFDKHLETIDTNNAIINFSSGTAEVPKLIPRYYYTKMMLNNLEYVNAKLFHDSMPVSFDKIDNNNEVKYLSKLMSTRLNTTFMTGFYWQLLSYGMTLSHVNDVHQMWPFIEKYQINLINAMPAVFQFSESSLLPYIRNDSKSLDLSSLRLIALSGDVPRNYYMLHIFKNLLNKPNIKTDDKNLNIWNFYP